MLSKSEQKKINGLRLKKNRTKEGLFIVEGIKLIEECLNSRLSLVNLYSTADYFNVEFITVSERELAKISQLKTPQKALAIFRIPDSSEAIENGLILALDAIRDPGNLGTIIRLADWYGVKHIICSEDTVDCYNPKVVQATMGSLARVNISYLNLLKFIKNSQLPAYVTALNGDSIYTIKFPENAVLIMGNEANGVSEEIMEHTTNKFLIPKFDESSAIESLNVATATAICLNEFRRPLLKGEI